MYSYKQQGAKLHFIQYIIYIIACMVTDSNQESYKRITLRGEIPSAASQALRVEIVNESAGVRSNAAKGPSPTATTTLAVVGYSSSSGCRTW